MDLTYFSPKTEKRVSGDRGARALFAREAISEGEIVVVIKGGYVMTRKQRDEVGRRLGPSEIQITEKLCSWGRLRRRSARVG